MRETQTSNPLITDDPKEFLNKFNQLKPIHTPLTMRQALLVDPSGLQINSQSATDNHYMDLSQNVDLARAKAQHNSLTEKIKSLGVEVKVFPGIVGQDDGMYPNNVFATADNTLIVGRMFHPVRQQEATRKDIREYFDSELNYRTIDLSQEKFICELTGSIIIDHARRVGFVGLSKRANREGAEAMHRAFNLNLTFCFDLVPEEYHTNIILALFAGKGGVFYPEGCTNPEAAKAICAAYGDRIIRINQAEKNAFAGNCLAITPQDVLFSNTSLKTMRAETRDAISSLDVNIHGCDVDELEKGGGSLRCLIAEIF